MIVFFNTFTLCHRKKSDVTLANSPWFCEEHIKYSENIFKTSFNNFKPFWKEFVELWNFILLKEQGLKTCVSMSSTYSGVSNIFSDILLMITNTHYWM